MKVDKHEELAVMRTYWRSHGHLNVPHPQCCCGWQPTCRVHSEWYWSVVSYLMGLFFSLGLERMARYLERKHHAKELSQ